jgi:hypothetical protein
LRKRERTMLPKESEQFRFAGREGGCFFLHVNNGVKTHVLTFLTF